MARALELVDTLKTELRKRRKTYRHIAAELELSESSVKRLLGGSDISLKRLQSICDLIDLDLAELMRLAEEERRNLHCLSLEHEQTLVGDTKLLLLTIYLANGWTYQQVLDLYHIDPYEGQRMLTLLDGMNIIELLPENKVRVLLAPDFEWLTDGPIAKYFQTEIQSRFFDSPFDEEGAIRIVMNGWLSKHSLLAFKDNVRRLAKEYEMQIADDKNVPMPERLGTTMVLAIRPWQFEVFDELARE